MTNGIIIVLGSPNDEHGNLSQIALERNQLAWEKYQQHTHFKILCTGGFGEHFNQTYLPHAHYSKQFLLGKGVSESNFLPLVMSSNTREDFLLSKPVIECENPHELIVITSDFHLERAKLLCDQTIGRHNTYFVAAQSSLSEDELRPLIEHEKRAIEKLILK